MSWIFSSNLIRHLSFELLPGLACKARMVGGSPTVSSTIRPRPIGRNTVGWRYHIILQVSRGSPLTDESIDNWTRGCNLRQGLISHGFHRATCHVEHGAWAWCRESRLDVFFNFTFLFSMKVIFANELLETGLSDYHFAITRRPILGLSSAV